MGRFTIKALDDVCNKCNRGQHSDCIVMEQFRVDNSNVFDFMDFQQPNKWLCACFRSSESRPGSYDAHLGGDEDEDDKEGLVSEPTKQRDGDQRLPDLSVDGPCVQDQIITMMEESKRVGVQRYGKTLHPFNGRRGTQDLVEEARDLLVYAMQIHMEANANGEQIFWAICQGLVEARNKVEGFELADFAVADRVARLITDRIMTGVTLKNRNDT